MISNLPVIEFKVIIIRYLMKLGEEWMNTVTSLTKN